jgi:signal transduction histidine kinase
MKSVGDRPRLLRIRTELGERDHVRMTVTDSGIGFDAQDAELLFEPFYSTKSTGMGIGLYLCRSIIERFRGRLCAMRNDGPGASFEFSIPCFSSEIAEA